jgi:ketosteroid isomerase-like protein
MNLRSTLALVATLVAISSNSALAQPAGDVEGVKAASKAFYAALTVLDDGSAMEKVWAHAPYVTLAGPRSKSILVGWDGQKKYWEESNKRFSQRNSVLLDQHVHVNGNLAWEMGRMTKNDYIVTNVYEKQANGNWLIVSHHVQPRPQ